MKTKEEIEQLAEHSSEVQEATYTTQHKITYKHGFIDGYNLSDQQTKELQKNIVKYTSLSLDYLNQINQLKDEIERLKGEN